MGYYNFPFLIGTLFYRSFLIANFIITKKQEMHRFVLHLLLFGDYFIHSVWKNSPLGLSVRS